MPPWASIFIILPKVPTVDLFPCWKESNNSVNSLEPFILTLYDK